MVPGFSFVVWKIYLKCAQREGCGLVNLWQTQALVLSQNREARKWRPHKNEHQADVNYGVESFDCMCIVLWLRILCKRLVIFVAFT